MKWTRVDKGEYVSDDKRYVILNTYHRRYGERSWMVYGPNQSTTVHGSMSAAKKWISRRELKRAKELTWSTPRFT